MVNFNEAVNRTSGVTVYSPTRRLNQQANQANAGTAARIAQGGQPQAPTMPTAGSVQMGAYNPPQIAQMPTQATSLADMLFNSPPPQPQPDEGGGGLSGLLGPVASPLGWVVGHGMDLLARPGRAVTSTINEVADVFNEGDASFGDWWDQFNDPSFGFGSVVGDITTNKWANRVIGFLGDVITDPLTYVAGAGVLNRTGRLGRLEGAAAAMGLAELGEGTASRIGRVGLSSLNNTERAAMREVGTKILDAGYHFKVPFMEKYWNIPFTGRLEQGVSRTTARVRARLAESGLGTALRRNATADELVPAVEKLITGRGRMSFAEAADTYVYGSFHRIGKRTAQARLVGTFKAMEKEIAQMADNAGAIERAETVGNTVLNRYFDTAAQLFEDLGGKKLQRQNYVPHIWTQEGLDWLRSGSLEAEEFQKVLLKGWNPNDASSAMHRRIIEANPNEPYIINGKEFWIKTGTISEINDRFAEHFPRAGFNLLEDDLPTIVSRYAEMLSDDIGTLAGIQAVVKSKNGLARKLEQGVPEENIDELLSKVAAPEARSKIKALLRANNEFVASARKDLLEGKVPQIQGMLAAEMIRVTNDLTTIPEGLKGQLGDLIQAEADAVEGRAAFVGTGIGDLGESLAVTAQALEQQLLEADARLVHLANAGNISKAEWDAARGDSSALIGLIKDRAKVEALQEWNEVSQRAVDLALDKATVDQLLMQVATSRARAGRMETALSDDSLLSSLMGFEGRRKLAPQLAADDSERLVLNTETGRLEKVSGPQERVDYDPRTGRIVSRTPIRMIPWKGPPLTLVRKDAQTTLDALAGESQAAREMSTRIQLQLGVVRTAEEKLHKTASLHTSYIHEHMIHVGRLRQMQADLRSSLEGLEGYPELEHWRQVMAGNLDDLEREGGILQGAIDDYNASQGPVADARKAMETERRALDDLRLQQEDIIFEEAIRRGGPIMDRAVEERVRNAITVLEARLKGIDEGPAGRTLKEARAQLNRLEYEEKNLRRPVVRVSEESPRLAAERRIAEMAPERQRLRQQVRTIEGQRTRVQRDLDNMQGRLKTTGNPLTAVEEQTLRGEIKGLQGQLDDLRRTHDGRSAAEYIRRDIPRVENTLRKTEQQIDGWTKSPFSAFHINEEGHLFPNDDVLGIPEVRKLALEQEGLFDDRAAASLRLQTAEADLATVARGDAAGKRAATKAINAAKRDIDKATKRLGEIDKAFTFRSRAGQRMPQVSYSRARNQLKNITKLIDRRNALIAEREGYLDVVRSVQHQTGEITEQLASRTATLEAQQAAKASRTGDLGQRLRQIRSDEAKQVRDLEAKANYKVEWEDVPEIPDADRSVYTLNDLLDMNDESLAKLRAKSPEAIVDDIGALNRLYHDLDELQTPGGAVPITPGQIKGGSNTLQSRAHRARDKANELLHPQSYQRLESSGAMTTGQLEFVRQQRAELSELLRQYQSDPYPMTRLAIEQSTADLTRLNRFMTRYHAVLARGDPASPQVGTFLAWTELVREDELLAKSMRRVEGDIARGHTEEMQGNIDAMLDLQTKITTDQETVARLTPEMEQRQAAGDPSYTDFKSKISTTNNRINRNTKKLDDMRDAMPELSAMNDDIDTITHWVTRLMEDPFIAGEEFNETRRLRNVLDAPLNDRKRFEVNIPYEEGKLARDVTNQDILRRAIFDAEGRGEQAVVVPVRIGTAETHDERAILAIINDEDQPEYWRNYMSARYRKAVADIEASQAKQGKIRPHVRGETKVYDLQGNLLRTETPIGAASKPVSITLGSPERYETKTIPLDAARARLASHDESIAATQAKIATDKVRLSVLNGSGQERMRVIEGLLDDADNGVQVEDIDRLLTEAHAMSVPPNQLKRHQQRIANYEQRKAQLEAGSLTLERRAELEAERLGIAQALQHYVTNTEGVMTHLEAAIDRTSFLSRLVEPGYQLTPADMKILKGLLPAEAAEVTGQISQLLHTINAVLADLPAEGLTRRVGVDPRVRQVEDMLQMLVATMGESELMDRFRKRLLDSIAERQEAALGLGNLSDQARDMIGLTARTPGPEYSGGQLNYASTNVVPGETPRVASAAPEDIAAQREAMGTRVESQSRYAAEGESGPAIPSEIEALPTDELTNELFTAAVAMAGDTYNTEISDAAQVINAMGLNPGVKNRLQDLGISTSTVSIDPIKLRQSVIKLLKDAGYDPHRQLKAQYSEMVARQIRMKMMISGLGGTIYSLEKRDPAGFIEFLGKMDDALGSVVDMDGVADDAAEFMNLVMPPDMAEVQANRLTALTAEMDDAVASGDEHAAQAAEDEIAGIITDQGAPLDRGAMAAELDQARAALDASQANLDQLRAAEPQAPTLDSIVESTPPPNFFTAAQIERAKQEANAYTKSLPPVGQRTAEQAARQQELIERQSHMTTHRWHAQPLEERQAVIDARGGRKSPALEQAERDHLAAQEAYTAAEDRLSHAADTPAEHIAEADPNSAVPPTDEIEVPQPEPTAPPPEPVAPTGRAGLAPGEPRQLTDEELAAGWSDESRQHLPTTAEIDALIARADAAAKSGQQMEYFTAHRGTDLAVRGERMGQMIRLPIGSDPPLGYYRTASEVGPFALEQQLGEMQDKMPGVLGRNLWNLGYRDAEEVTATGLRPQQIVTGEIRIGDPRYYVAPEGARQPTLAERGITEWEAPPPGTSLGGTMSNGEEFVQPAPGAAGPLNDPAATIAEGVNPGEIAPDEIPPQVVDRSVPDESLTPEMVRTEYEAVVKEFEDLKAGYGSLDVPPNIVQQKQKLAERAQQLVDLQQSRRAPAPPPEAAAARREVLKEAAAAGGSGRVKYDYWQVLSKGTPSQNTLRSVLPDWYSEPPAVGKAVVGGGRELTETSDELFDIIPNPKRPHLGEGGERVIRKPRELEGDEEMLGEIGDLGEAEAALQAEELARLGGGERTSRQKLLTLRASLRARINPAGPFMRNNIEHQIRKIEQRLAPANEFRGRLTTEIQRELEEADATELYLKRRGHIPDTGPVDPARVESVAADVVEARQPSQLTPEALEDQYNEVQEQIAAATSSRDTIAAARQSNAEDRARLEADYNTGLANIDAGLADVRMRLADVRTKAGIGPDDEATRKLAERVVVAPTRLTKGFPQLLDDMREVLKLQATGGLEPAEVQTVAALIDGAAAQYDKIITTKASSELLAQRLKELAKNPKKASNTVKSLAVDGWTPIAKNLLAQDDAIEVTNGLARGLTNLTTALARPDTWKVVDYYTQFFKTYATARPGFHVRNAMSGVFMNLVDRVRVRNMFEAPSMWRRFMKDPEEFFARNNARENYAIQVVFGSGSGGQFIDRAVPSNATMSNKAYRKVMDNTFTRWNKRAGTTVEGSLRLSMALDSFDKGMSIGEALARVTKYHFDYTQISRMDRQARRFIPFWTFMSRNLPLQLEQMLLRPRMYQQYRAFRNNFQEEADPLTPEYWLMQGAFTMDENAAERDAPWYLAPDLPFTRVTEPFDALAHGEIGKALLSDINPGFLAPVEAFGFGKKVYTGAPIEGYNEDSSTVMQALSPLFALLGGAERGASGDWVNKNSYEHVARSLIPTLDLIERLTDTGGTRAGRQDETFYRQALGLPVYQLTDELRRSTANTEFWNRRDENALNAQLARS